jgi:hypothetical protein
MTKQKRFIITNPHDAGVTLFSDFGSPPEPTPAEEPQPTEAAAGVPADPWQAIVRTLLIEIWAQQTFHQPRERTEANMLTVAASLRRSVDVDATAKALAELVPHGGNALLADVLTLPVFRLAPFLDRGSRDALIAVLTDAAQQEMPA